MVEDDADSKADATVAPDGGGTSTAEIVEIPAESNATEDNIKDAESCVQKDTAAGQIVANEEENNIDEKLKNDGMCNMLSESLLHWHSTMRVLALSIKDDHAEMNVIEVADDNDELLEKNEVEDNATPKDNERKSSPIVGDLENMKDSAASMLMATSDLDTKPIKVLAMETTKGTTTPIDPRSLAAFYICAFIRNCIRFL